MRQFKCIAFSEDEVGLLEWVTQKGKFSRYIKGLIRRDITEKEWTEQMAELVERTLDARLAGRMAPVGSNINAPTDGAKVDRNLLQGMF